MSRRRLACGILVCSLTAPVSAGEPLAGIPRPELGLLEEEVARRLRSEREEVERLVAAGDASDEEVGAALGRIGGLYYLYDFIDLARRCLVEAERLQPKEWRWPYLRGLALQLDGDLKAARAALLRAVELGAGDPAVRVHLGEILFDLGRLEEAEASFRQALERDPDRAAAHYGLGRLAAARGEHEGAIASFERALALQPGATSIYHQIGMAHRALGDLEAARRQLARNTGGRVRVEDPVVDAMASELGSGGRAFSAGVQAMKAGRFEEAITLFLAAREERPGDHLVDYNLALAYLRTDRRQPAVEALRQSVEKNPGFRNGHFNLASLLAEDGNDREAEFHFGRAHAIDPDDAEAHLEWATTLSRGGQDERAAAELESLLARSPQLTAARVRLGTLQLNAGRARQAEESFRRVLEGDADAETRARAHSGLARLAQDRKEWKAAVEHLQEVLRQRSGPDPDTRLALANVLGRSGRFGEAAEAFSAVIESRPEAVEPHFGRAMALLLGERYTDAQAAIEASLVVHDTSVPLRHLYARLLATAPDEAVRDGESALALATEVLRLSQTLDHAETVAMALAESGRFTEAVEWQRRVVSQARQAANPAAAGAAERRLELYERGEACRAPWLGG